MAARGIATKHVRLSIRDVDVPTVAGMREILAADEGALANRETVYVHCWGGVGRTGTVVGCLLVNRGMEPANALERIAELRVDTKRAGRVSPETVEQRDFVMSWKGRPGRGPPMGTGAGGPTDQTSELAGARPT